MKVFVSSTAFDLIDIRAELEAHLRSLGLTPVMSDVRTADFDVRTGKNSIETCLINLRACDAVIVVLDKRYGPTLGKAGFDDISATHLEYREAKAARKQILFYVRDRLEADYRLWHGERDETKRGDLTYSWVTSPKDHGLFACLREHRQLDSEAEHSNWFMTFRDSIELKQLVTRDLGAVAAKTELENLLRDGRVPCVSIRLEFLEHPVSDFSPLTMTITNLSTTPILDLNATITDDPQNSTEVQLPWIAAGEARQCIILSEEIHPMEIDWISLDYRMPIGHQISDEFRVFTQTRNFLGRLQGTASGTDWVFTVTLESRNFTPRTPGSNPHLGIVDPMP